MVAGLTIYLTTLCAGLALLLAGYAKGRLAGVRRERERRAGEDALARDITDAVDNDVGAMPSAIAREELRRWAK